MNIVDWGNHRQKKKSTNVKINLVKLLVVQIESMVK